MKSRRLFLRWFSGSAIAAQVFSGIALTGNRAANAQARRNSGWLELRQLQGKAIYQTGNKRLKAWIGMRLTQVGEIFETAPGASAILSLDQGLGTIQVAEQTRFRIKAINTTAGGGRVTLVDVMEGQVRLKVRPMNNPSSTLEVFTPVGMNGVRGTDFGVSVQPSGKSSVATLSGKVDTIAMGETQAIGAGLQTLTMPGEAPQPPKELQDNPDARVTLSLIEGNVLRMVGQTDAVNNMFINGESQDTDRNGNFDISFPVGDADFVQLYIVTPLGKRRDYKLPLR